MDFQCFFLVFIGIKVPVYHKKSGSVNTQGSKESPVTVWTKELIHADLPEVRCFSVWVYKITRRCQRGWTKKESVEEVK